MTTQPVSHQPGKNSPANAVQVFKVLSIKNLDQAFAHLNKLFMPTEPGSVFDRPLTADEHTVLTASELCTGLGVGLGDGPRNHNAGATTKGGGGGASLHRPVASISMSSYGVKVEPVFDPTTTAIAAVTTLCALFIRWRAIRKAGRN